MWVSLIRIMPATFSVDGFNFLHLVIKVKVVYSLITQSFPNEIYLFFGKLQRCDDVVLMNQTLIIKFFDEYHQFLLDQLQMELS